MDIAANITGLQHIGLPSLNLADSCSFYAKLGFVKIFDKKFVDDTNTPGHACFMRLGTLVLEIYEQPEIAGRAGAVDHIALNVKDIEEAFAAVTALGLNNTEDKIHFLPFFEHGVKFFTIEGPSREKVEFNQYLQA